MSNPPYLQYNNPDPVKIGKEWTLPHEPDGEWQRPNDLAEGTGEIQWKGTNVCMDVSFPCGCNEHIDAGFAYYIECDCGMLYQASTTIAFRNVNPLQRMSWKVDGGVIIRFEDL